MQFCANKIISQRINRCYMQFVCSKLDEHIYTHAQPHLYTYKHRCSCPPKDSLHVLNNTKLMCTYSHNQRIHMHTKQVSSILPMKNLPLPSSPSLFAYIRTNMDCTTYSHSKGLLTTLNGACVSLHVLAVRESPSFSFSCGCNSTKNMRRETPGISFHSPSFPKR